MKRSLFFLFLVTDLIVSLLMIVANEQGDRGMMLAVVTGSLLVRTPLVSIVLLGTYWLVRRLSHAAPRVDPYVWFVAGIAAGYFFGFAALSVLVNGTPFDWEWFQWGHSEFRMWLAVWSAYPIAFVVTSIAYLAGKATTRRKGADSA